MSDSNKKPDDRSLYFTNKSLFADNYLLNHLPKERNDRFVLQNWETEPLPAFNECYEWMLSTWAENKAHFSSLNEAQLEEQWIRPILKLLGWKLEVQDRFIRQGQTKIPDYSLFASEAQYKKGKECTTSEAYFQHVSVVADAKAMDIPLDGAKNKSDPSFQIVSYMELTGVNWGILTNGEYWRIYSTRPRSKTTTYYEVNVRKFLNPTNSPRNDEAFKYFFNFFRKEAFVDKDVAGKCFLDVVYESGERYAEEVETELKERAFKFVESLCKGFAADRKVSDPAELKEIYQHSLYYLFRLLFILNCEAKSILDVNEFEGYRSYSLRNLVEKLKIELQRATKWSKLPTTYEYISNLMKLISEGDEAINLVGFGDKVFSCGNPDFFKKNKISDFSLNKLIVDLACTQSDERHFIDYGRLGADHLGSIFEGLLEYELRYADQDYAVNKKGKIVPATEIEEDEEVTETFPKGSLFLATGSGERNETGSFYTPSYVVDYMVRNSLQPICSKATASELMKLRVCDPAMGSGHFLLGAISFLEEQYKAKADSENLTELDPLEIRWNILKNCILGVDKNSLAVELAKFSLWIYSARKQKPLEPLDDQLLEGDSLLEDDGGIPFSWKKSFSKEMIGDGIDAIIGNPPYVARKNSGYVEKIPELDGQSDLYIAFLSLSLSGRIPLKENGIISMIVPDPVLIRHNAKKIREKILKQHRLAVCVHINGVFDAGVSNAILTIRRGLAESGKVQAKFYRVDNKEIRERFKATSVIPRECAVKTIDTEMFLGTEGYAFAYLVDKADLSNFELLRRGKKTLSNYFKDSRGEEIGKKQINENVTTKSGKAILLGGEGIGPFEIRQNAVKKVSPSFIKKPQSFYSAPKVILQKSAAKFVCAVDNGSIDKAGLAVPQSIYILKPKEANCAIDVWAMAAILNTDLANDYLFKCVTGYKLLQPHFEQQDMKDFPLFEVSDLNKKLIDSERSRLLSELKKSEGAELKLGKSRESLLASLSAISEYIHELKVLDAEAEAIDHLRAEIESNLIKLYKLTVAAEVAA